MNQSLKWYDYIAAFLLADTITTLLFMGLMSSSFIISFIFGIGIMLLFDAWNVYCNYRKDKDLF